MTILHSIILGIVEGFTEFLPISSTGHLILVSQLLHIAQSDFVKSFEIVIQLGAILAVVALYWRRLLVNWQVFSRVVVAFIPTGIIGLLLYKVVKTYLIGNTAVTLLALFIGGILLIVFELLHKENFDASAEVEEISYKKSFIIGLCQGIAVIPGVSRAAATIVGGLLLNVRRATIVEFSFLLAVPTMAAATGLDLIKNYQNFNSSDTLILLIGFVVSFVVAIFAIKFFLNFIKNHTFISFGIYRVIISVIFWLTISSI